MKAIETKYKGYRFRSRLEARWAVFFDALGIAWEYEPEGYQFADGTRYLPDFFLPGFHRCPVEGRAGLYVEVKPGDYDDAAFAKARMLAHVGGCAVLCAAGEPAFTALRAYAPVFDGGVLLGYDDLTVCFREGLDVEYGLFVLDDFCSDFSAVSEVGGSVVAAAIDAARSARFEFGESGEVR